MFTNFTFTLCGLSLCAFVACEKPVVDYADKDDDVSVVPPDESGKEHGDTLIAVNDTARFYLSGIEISGITLMDCPTPQTLIKDSRYRLPRRLEIAQVLGSVSLPEGYWRSRQRILCYDSPLDNGVKIGSTLFGTGGYYTYTPHGTITKAGYKTDYCILPIRTERLPQQDGHVEIDVDDEWK